MTHVTMNKNDSNQKQNHTNTKKSEDEIKSNNTNSKENSQNVKKQKLSITISTEEKNKQVEFVDLEEESEDPLDQFEDAMEEDGHIEINNQENHIKSPESIVTDQENQRTHKDKNTGNIVRQPQTRPRRKLPPNERPPVPSPSVSHCHQPNALGQSWNYHQILHYYHHHWVKASSIWIITKLICQWITIKTIILRRQISTPITTTRSIVMWLSRRQPKSPIKNYWNIWQRNHHYKLWQWHQ